MDYSQLSDFEINKRVAKSIYSVSFVEPLSRTVSVSGGKRLFDPCNNPADAWPIIDKYRISIINLGEDEWGARGVADCKSKRAIHENSLRAAMIVFLMMQDANHA
ncbi:TPA: phage protein NinX family protein [Enterobacter cloacae]